MRPKATFGSFVKKSNILLIFLAFSVNLVIAAEARSEPKEEYVLKWGTVLPTAGVLDEALVRIKRMIEEQTGGGIKNIWYTGGVMGDEPDLIRKVKLGQLQGLLLTAPGLNKVASEIFSFTLPLFYKNSGEIDCAFSRGWPTIEEIFSKRGFVNLGYADLGGVLFMAKVEPKQKKELFQGKWIPPNQYIITDPAETDRIFKQLKLWMWVGAEQFADYLVKIMGGNFKAIIPLSVPEVLMGLQTGMVDMIYATCITLLGLQWQTQTDYLFNFDGYEGLGHPSIMVLFDQKTFGSLPVKYQKIIRAAFQSEFGPKSSRLTSMLREDEEKTCSAIFKRGFGRITITSEAMTAMEKRAEKTYQDIVGKLFSSELLQQVTSIRDQCRRELEPGAHEKAQKP